MGAPAEGDIVITRGDTVAIVVIMTSDGTTPINITGRTYAAQVRTQADSPDIVLTMTCAVTNGAAGEVTCSLTHAQTIVPSAGNYVWDLEENASGTYSTPLSGGFTILADVTR